MRPGRPEEPTCRLRPAMWRYAAIGPMGNDLLLRAGLQQLFLTGSRARVSLWSRQALARNSTLQLRVVPRTHRSA